MANKCEDELICDLAEYYHIYNYKKIPLSTVAVLTRGLREDSRVMMCMGGEKGDFKTKLFALMTDYLAFITWSKTKDAQKGINAPKSIFDSVFAKKMDDDVKAYYTGEEFLKAREKILKAGETNGN